VARDEARRDRARRILEAQGRQPFEFQNELASRSLSVVRDGGRLLVLAPTGSGKTLISQLVAALLAEEYKRKIPRVLVVVPSRGLVEQHFVDAAWLRNGSGMALHMLSSDTPLPMVAAMMRSYGVVFTTPVTVARRLAMLPHDVDGLRGFDCALFDEIDTYLTVDDLAERRDTFPALQACLDAALPVIGFTGTNLDSAQVKAWKSRSFREAKAAVPEDWLPSTNVQFVGVRDQVVIDGDTHIREELRRAFLALQAGGLTPTWREVKKLASGGDPRALRILTLCAERLALFESLGSTGQKVGVVVDGARAGTSLILTRFRRSAEDISGRLNEVGVHSTFAHGGMTREDIAFVLNGFRTAAADATTALVLTRELGGRGLDFPNASRAFLFSPRSNHQAVAQELARIRSRRGSLKPATVIYYESTEEAAKAHRLGLSLRHQRYEGKALFNIGDLPADDYRLVGIEGRISYYEETVSLQSTDPETSRSAKYGLRIGLSPSSESSSTTS
jgi:superfamily II DNA/RNA helicase